MVAVRRTLTGDEGDELADTFLHAFLGFFGNFGIVWKGTFHNSGDWCKVAYVSIGSDIVLSVSGTQWL